MQAQCPECSATLHVPEAGTDPGATTSCDACGRSVRPGLFRCPGCSAALRVVRERLPEGGGRGRCPACARFIDVPDLRDLTPASTLRMSAAQIQHAITPAGAPAEEGRQPPMGVPRPSRSESPVLTGGEDDAWLAERRGPGTAVSAVARGEEIEILDQDEDAEEEQVELLDGEEDRGVETVRLSGPDRSADVEEAQTRRLAAEQLRPQPPPAPEPVPEAMHAPAPRVQGPASEAAATVRMTGAPSSLPPSRPRTPTATSRVPSLPPPPTAAAGGRGRGAIFGLLLGAALGAGGTFAASQYGFWTPPPSPLDAVLPALDPTLAWPAVTGAAGGLVGALLGSLLGGRR